MRCTWCNINNPLYIKYHDNEWGKLNLDEHYLYEMFVLETFTSGLSFECILNKRENLRYALDNFDIDKIINYDISKINALLNNKGIIRNKLKIYALINNSKIYKEIVLEYKSFKNYLLTFTGNNVLFELDKTTNNISDSISKNLKKRGMKFVGSITIYSYLQAIGLINSHQKECFLYKKDY